MTSALELVRAGFYDLKGALDERFPGLSALLRPPVDYEAPDYMNEPGAEQLAALWSLTSGQDEALLGVLGGEQLLGPEDSEHWHDWPEWTEGSGIHAIYEPDWDNTRAHPQDALAVRGVQRAAGWIPFLKIPMEGNYLAVDLVPLEKGRPGQIIVFGRDFNTLSVVSPDLATFLHELADDCRAGNWQLVSNNKGQPYMNRNDHSVITDCAAREFPSRV
jgi:SMI1 / KNR4 family (SUKH-1)